MAVHAAERIGHAVAGIGAHPARARLVLAGAEFLFYGPAPDALGTAGAQPLLGACAHELSGANGLGVRRPAEAGDGEAEGVAHRGVERDAGIGRGDFLHRTAHIDAAAEEVAHGAFVGEPPARRVGRQRLSPKDEREFDEVVGEHRTTDDAGVPVIKLRRGDGDAGAEEGRFDVGREEAVGDGISVALDMAAEVVAVVAQAVGLKRRRGEQQQARGLDGAAGNDDRPGASGAALQRRGVGRGRREIFDADGLAGAVSKNP